MNSVHLSPEAKSIGTKAIQTKAKSIGLLLSVNFPPSPLPVVIAAASLSRQGYLTRVDNMMLENINLDSVPHAACLGDIQVDGWVVINNVQGDIGSMLVPDLVGVIWLWPFTVQDHIYGCSNFGHRFCLLALWTKFMVKI